MFDIDRSIKKMIGDKRFGGPTKKLNQLPLQDIVHIQQLILDKQRDIGEGDYYYKVYERLYQKFGKLANGIPQNFSESEKDMVKDL